MAGDSAPASDITFIVPVRHQSNCQDWNEARARIAQTMRSIAAQDYGGWRAVIVANYGADLPPLLPGFTVAWVNFPPNDLHEKGNNEKEKFYDAFRIDKGRRVLAGMLHAEASEYFMIVDDDDFVSQTLARFVHTNKGKNGWFIRHGWVWSTDTRFTYFHSGFSKLCGSSHIIRSELYKIASNLENYSDEQIKIMLGSHIFIAKYLESHGVPLAPLPFPGAVYRIGHAGAHSRSRGLLRTFLFTKANLRSPVAAVKALMRFRLLTSSVRQEFNLPSTRSLIRLAGSSPSWRQTRSRTPK